MEIRDKRANAPRWLLFAVACSLFLIFAIGAMGLFGVPGSTGGTSNSQQQTSGSPQPSNEIQDGHTRENTTGYGRKE